jgi:hypothetical protein
MSPRRFWNHPLPELARSLTRALGPDEPGGLTREELNEFLLRLVGTTAGAPLVPQRVRARVPVPGDRRNPFDDHR